MKCVIGGQCGTNNFREVGWCVSFDHALVTYVACVELKSYTVTVEKNEVYTSGNAIFDSTRGRISNTPRYENIGYRYCIPSFASIAVELYFNSFHFIIIDS